jgi:hypothetical protein
MEIESEEHLFTYLQEELAWRKKELTHIKFLIESANKNELDFNLRIGITFLYAHWEGFVKESTAYYINFLRNQNYTYGELTDCFVGWTLKPKIKLCLNSEKVSLYYEVIDILVNKKNELAEIPPEQKLFETPFILNYEKFVDLCFILGIRQNLFELKRNFIDLELVDKRNNVAHGRRFYIKTTDYDEYHKTIISMLDAFYSEFSDVIINKRYKKG